MPSASFAPDSRINDAADAKASPPQKSFGKGQVYVIMGPPASGKGTQCQKLVEKFGFVHLSTGDVFRDLAKRGTELGLRAKEFIDKGCFVPDEMVLSLVRDRLSQPDVQERGCLLDGFPRTADQVEALLKDVKIDGVLLLQVPEKTLIGRSQDRRVDPDTGNIYHLKFVPPPTSIVDRLERRDLDDEHSFRQRLQVFKEQSRRVLPFFSGQSLKIDGTLTPAEVHSNMVRAIEGLSSRRDAVFNKATDTQGPTNSCAICFDEPADFLVVPCGHQCGCEECLKAVQAHSGRCPICRNRVESIQRVFRCGRGSEEEAASAGIPGTVSKSPPTHADIQDKLDAQAKIAKEKADDDWSDDEDLNINDQQQQGFVQLVATPCTDVKDQDVVKVMVTAEVPDIDVSDRPPVDICCVVDVSGSMGSMATYETEDGQKKDDGLTVLDIVKHAVKTVIKALEPQDRLALVAFDDKQTKALPITSMTPEGHKNALKALEDLRPGGQTNIWGGVHCAMEALREGNSSAGNASAGRKQAILLLTDGQPNIVPPRGHMVELRNYKDTHPDFSFQVNTFGFGYNLDSELLLDLAKEGNGTYAFIPDAVIVGTTFVNSVANVISTLTHNATLNIMTQNGAAIVGEVQGAVSEHVESWGRAINLGPLQYGQSRDIVVPIRIPKALMGDSDKPYLEAILSYPASNGTTGRASVTTASRTASTDAVVALCRTDAVRTGYDAISKGVQGTKVSGKEAGQDVEDLAKRVKHQEASLAGVVDGRLVALKADVQGRMHKALQGKERFNRWGKHYLRALVRAHQLQVCTNFMDTGLQPYGGRLFRALRDKGDQIFLSLPPPKPSRPKPVAATTTSCNRSASPASPQMNTYYAGAGGGCFDPSCKVLLVTQTSVGEEFEQQIALGDVSPGDTLRVADGGVAKVRCIAMIDRHVAKPLVALPDGLKITPKHPVRLNSEWQLPKSLPNKLLVPSLSGQVCNVLLDRCHVLPINGIECATWGHGLTGPIIGHPFFGTEKVVSDLEAMQGWNQGLVHIKGSIRDGDGEVVGLIESR
eukprot:TRINITY_DN93500_c0_g1_i1.p1 TRINITY_DN93500_c0_g1~~TRINITY_DN93500_c0_g1_i1.p1  ORF type:complete len:1048 (-),score=211.18 TRINITY_DN93500_c0_g1_i1:125-3268(-)